ncbi:hypothetical protein [Sporosarcina sp. FSL K6-1508]|uniref:hypothetical protein n=1 Tax=Sporosarcina sp. FSL K6-1508 TaxID=2921553 RepID=UPI0030FAD23C
MFYVAVWVGIVKLYFFDEASTFEMLVILLLIHIVGQLQKKEIVNHTHYHINNTKNK